MADAFGHPPVTAAAKAPEAGNAPERILVLLHSHTGHDFSGYKMKVPDGKPG